MRSQNKYSRFVAISTLLCVFLLLFSCESKHITYFSGGSGPGPVDAQYIYYDFNGVNFTNDSQDNKNVDISDSQQLIVYQKNVSSGNADIFINDFNLNNVSLQYIICRSKSMDLDD